MSPTNDDWTTALDRFRKAQVFEGISKTTRANQRGHVRAAAQWLDCPLSEVTSGHLQRYIDHRAFRPATRRNYIKSYRAFWRWCYESGITSTNPALALRLDLDTAAEQAVITRSRTVKETTRYGPVAQPIPEPWATWITEWRRYLRAAGTPETTIHLRTAHIAWCARALSPITPTDVSLDDIIEWMVGRDWANETRRSVRSSLRVFYTWAQETGRADHNPADRLPRVRASAAVPRPVMEADYQRALSEAPPRERLMLRLSAEMGLRRAEVAQLHSRDVMGMVSGGYALVVHGKGAKQRVLPLSDSLAADLREQGEGYIFPGANNPGHLSPGRVGRLVTQYLPAGVSMHKLRHRFATAAYAASGDLLTVQKMLGHNDPNTTQRYVAVSDSAARELIAQIERASDPMRIGR